MGYAVHDVMHPQINPDDLLVRRTVQGAMAEAAGLPGGRVYVVGHPPMTVLWYLEREAWRVRRVGSLGEVKNLPGEMVVMSFKEGEEVEPAGYGVVERREMRVEIWSAGDAFVRVERLVALQGTGLKGS